MDEVPSLVSSRVKCPVCGHSLMDEKRPVDNCPSIRLNVQVGEESGVINLSSVWESYNYLCTIETKKNEILQLSCPHCNSHIEGKTDCEVCNAPMVHMELELGGSVCVCSRMGCRSHFVKFVDFSFALKQLYIDAGYQGRPYIEDMSVIPVKKAPLSEEEEHIETLHSGTFLRTYCPYCKKSLIQDGSVKLKVDRGSKEGFIMLSPYLNVFTSRSTIRLSEDEIVANIRCPHCNQTLEIPDEECGECGSRVARMLVEATNRLVDFYVCSKKGCTWHGLSREDMNDIRLEQSLEW
jgi:ssDNA-binding Zn-finger/Zn-ribbon topoisomerase 1